MDLNRISFGKYIVYSPLLRGTEIRWNFEGTDENRAAQSPTGISALVAPSAIIPASYSTHFSWCDRKINTTPPFLRPRFQRKKADGRICSYSGNPSDLKTRVSRYKPISEDGYLKRGVAKKESKYWAVRPIRAPWMGFFEGWGRSLSFVMLMLGRQFSSLFFLIASTNFW